MKASGLGFAMGSRGFTLALGAGAQTHGPYCVLDLPAPTGFQAALAFAGPEPTVLTEFL
jgi:hypothetical protein